MRSMDPVPLPMVTADMELAGPGWTLKTKMTVPAGLTRLIELLPLANSLANAVVDVAVNAVKERGEAISCKKGCGACCRQLVPISEAEARRVRDVVNEMPEPRRTQVRARFAEARRRFAEAGLLAKLEQREGWKKEDFQAVGLEYFLQKVACPFLEEESCSIYMDRPVTCREYLVTSPAEHCAKPTLETIRCVQLPLKVQHALTRFDPVPATARYVRWVPLALAPDWADAHPDASIPRPGPELLRELFDLLADRERAKTEPQAPSLGAAVDK
jgi:Fe-S-cluster containining protein